MPGRLFICGTPIGNLEDVSQRLLRVLAEVQIIAAEDTRQSRKLLDRFGISGKLVSHHDSNEAKQVPWLVERMKSGDKVALVTDAGMPAVSDPGYRLITECIAQGVAIEVVPGPSAITSALVVSGLPIARFSFEGFLPRKPGDARRRLTKIASDDRTLIFFEAANRVEATIGLIVQVLGDRPMAVARELTKIHEEVLRGTGSELLPLVKELRGEVVLLVQGATDSGDADVAIGYAKDLVREGVTKSKAAAEAATRFGVTRKIVYDALVREG